MPSLIKALPAGLLRRMLQPTLKFKPLSKALPAGLLQRMLQPTLKFKSIMSPCVQHLLLRLESFLSHLTDIQLNATNGTLFLTVRHLLEVDITRVQILLSL